MNPFVHYQVVRAGRAAAVFLLAAGTIGQAANWPAWNGPSGNSVSPETDLPLKWSSTQNIRWKVALPDRGNSSPIVWEKRIFVTQAMEKEKRRTVMCFDRATGDLVWQKGITYAEPESTHETNPYCSASPVTDGERVVAWFGSAGVVCYDFAGTELWKRDLGKQVHEWGYGSSPVLHGDLCLIHFGPGTTNFLIALDKKTGKTVWKTDLPFVAPSSRTDGFAGRKANDGVVGSWSTPLLVPSPTGTQVVLSVPEAIKAFDPKTGVERWHCRGLNPLIYTSAIQGEDVVVAMGGFMGTAMAVRTGGEGDVTSTHRLWQKTRTKNRIGSGVIKDGHVYILNTGGVGECLSLETGSVVWESRMAGPGAKTESWSSMVLAGDRIYVANQSGDVVIIRASPKFEQLAANSIGNELCNSTLAISDGDLFLRTHLHLWCISAAKSAALP